MSRQDVPGIDVAGMYCAEDNTTVKESVQGIGAAIHVLAELVVIALTAILLLFIVFCYLGVS